MQHTEKKFIPSLSLFQADVEVEELAHAIAYAEIPARKYLCGIECVQGYFIVPKLQRNRLYNSDEISLLKLCLPMQESPEVRNTTRERLKPFPDLKNSVSIDHKKRIMKEMFDEMRGGEFLPYFYSSDSDKLLGKRIKRFSGIFNALEDEINAKKIFAYDSKRSRLALGEERIDIRLAMPVYISKENIWKCLDNWGVRSWWDAFLTEHPGAEFDRIPYVDFDSKGADEGKLGLKPEELYVYATELICGRIDEMLDNFERPIRPPSDRVAVIPEFLPAIFDEVSDHKNNDVIDLKHLDCDVRSEVPSVDAIQSEHSKEADFIDTNDTNKAVLLSGNFDADSVRQVVEQELWNINQIAQALQMSESQAWKAVSGKLCGEPFPVKIPNLGRFSVWKKDEVLQWHQKFVELKQPKTL